MSQLDPSLRALARDVYERDLFDPLWPGLTESDWARDAQILAAALLDIDGSLVPFPTADEQEPTS
ncbi:MAG TPA: hypothetical protein VNJ54_12670 [Plantibacter sp.]|uniref:hypothetical protein n=1 Tax=Plantibacter sp. TaxID=1871045 RepID=UPI002D0DC4CF|nr:hypothetical protein [Plantibacter sp.]